MDAHKATINNNDNERFRPLGLSPLLETRREIRAMASEDDTATLKNTTAAANSQHIKSIFRKTTTSKKQQPGRQRSIRANDSDSVDSYDGESSALPLQRANEKDGSAIDDTVLETILANKRKREMKQTLRMQGNKITAKASSSNKEASTMAPPASNRSTTLRKDSTKANSVSVLNDTFSSSKHGRKKEKQDEEFDETTALGRKHKQAMEEYIQKQMQTTNVDSKEQSQQEASSKDRKKFKTDHHEALYHELSAKIITQGEDAAGNIVSFTSTGTKVISKQDAALAPTEKIKEGDVGSGGTMLGGTGIAEVILPIDHRIGIIRETQQAVMEKMQGHKSGTLLRPAADKQQADQESVDWTRLLPMNFESGPSKRRHLEESSAASSTAVVDPMKPIATSAFRYSASSAGDDVLPSDVQAVSASYAHNFQLHSHEWISRRKEERDLEIEKQRLSHEVAEGPVGNRGRVGFAVMRGKEQGGAPRNVDDAGKGTSATNRSSWRDSNQNRSNDDRVWSSFVKYQKERGGKRR